MNNSYKNEVPSGATLGTGGGVCSDLHSYLHSHFTTVSLRLQVLLEVKR